MGPDDFCCEATWGEAEDPRCEKNFNFCDSGHHSGGRKMIRVNTSVKALAAAVAVASGLGGVAANAHAQGAALEEVLVTATKRTESLQDVPISVAVVSAEMISTFDIGDVTDLQNFVPGLQVQETFGGTSIRIRGIGSGITNLAFDSSVPVFVDDVYNGRSNSVLSSMLDPGRVEVARGPQGAIFGKSTTAGAISIVSARPTEEFEAQLKLGTELEYGGYTASGFVSGALTESIRGRAAIFVNDLDGWTDNRVTGDDDGSEETTAGRVSLEFDANDCTTWYLKFESGSKDGEGRNNQPVRGLNIPNIPPFAGMYAVQAAELAAGTLEYKPDDVRGVSTGFPKEDYSEYDWTNFTAIMDSEFAGHAVKLIASHNEYDNTYYLDVDGFAADALNSYLTDDYDADSVELRFLSPTDQFIEYIGGVWYQSTDTKTQQWAEYGVVTAPVLKGNTLPYPTGTDRHYDRDTDAYSVYGQLTFNFTSDFRAIVDLRYTDEEQDSEAYMRQVKWETFENWKSPALNPALNGRNEYTFKQDRSDDSFDPSVRLQYDLTDDMMVYASYAHGSKAGGTKANDGGLSTVLQGVAAEQGDAWALKYTGVPAATLTDAYIAANLIDFDQGNGVFDFEDEEADSYEIGFKATLADGSVYLNGAVFTTEYKNLQTSSYNGTAFVIGNAGQATIDGAELELSWQATENLRINTAASYIDATYDDYPGASCVLDENLLAKNADCSSGQGKPGTNGTENQKGEPLERSPDLEYNINALWDAPITDNLMLKVAGSIYYSDSYFIQPTQEPYSTQDSYTKYDLRVALASADERWEVAVNGRNLSDEMVISHAYRVFSRFNNLTKGRTVSLEGILRF